MRLLAGSHASLRNALALATEPASALLIIFSAVTMGTFQFMRHAFPSGSAVPISTTVVVLFILVFVIAPTVVLFLVDRLAGRLDGTGRAVRVYRITLFLAALLLLGRQLQLYFGPVESLGDAIEELGNRILLGGLVFIALGLVTWFCFRAYQGMSLFFLYMSPVALFLLATLPFDVPDAPQLPVTGVRPLGEQYPAGIPAVSYPGQQPPVFVIIFDEVSRDALLENGEIDASSFPNFAALAEEGVWFTNATSNYFHSKFAVPSITDAVLPLANSYAVRLYEQYPVVERAYQSDCGVLYTCRGVSYVAGKYTGFLVADLALRSLYEATPDVFEPAFETPARWLVDRLGTTYRSVDPVGVHVISKRQFDVFLGDITGREAAGKIYLYHSFLPHNPFVFDEEGNVNTPAHTTFYVNGASFPNVYENYRRQIMFVDSLLGRFLDKLRQEDIYDDAVIIVTSDHGLRPILPHDSVPIAVDHSLTQIPMLIRAPGIEPQVLDIDYQHIDFGPTLLDVLGVPHVDGYSGVSAFDEARPERDKLFLVDDGDGTYWTYVYESEDDAWRLTSSVEGPLLLDQ